jgi:copper chaperone CopZ
MKYFKTIAAVFGLVSLSMVFSKTNAQTTTSFKLNGNVACKSSIEAVLNGIHGVVSVAWDATTKIATIVYNSEEIKEDLIYVYFAEGGYDTDKLRAKQRNYDALAPECKYQRDPERD